MSSSIDGDSSVAKLLAEQIGKMPPALRWSVLCVIVGVLLTVYVLQNANRGAGGQRGDIEIEASDSPTLVSGDGNETSIVNCSSSGP